MTSPVPNLQAALVAIRENKGFLIPPWNSFFQQLTQRAPKVVNVNVTGSPFSYTANANGNLIISGGIVSAITLIRGLVSIPLSTVRPLIIPISIGDTVKITFTGTPTLQFLGA